MTIFGWILLVLTMIQTVRFHMYRKGVRKEVLKFKEKFNALFQMGIVLGWQEAKEHPEMTLEQARNSLLRLRRSLDWKIGASL